MRDVMWAPFAGEGLEHLQLGADGCSSVVIGTADGRPYSFAYQLTWDALWHTRSIEAGLLGDDHRTLHMRSDGEGHWKTGQGETLPALDGCLDVDFTVSPFTNTLPIRRLGLQVGQAAELRVLYVTVPALLAKPATQRYTRLDLTHYRYESATFRVDLPIDADGVVLAYPGI